MLGIGSLSYEKAGKLALTGWNVLDASWFLAFAIVFLMPLYFPSRFQTELLTVFAYNKQFTKTKILLIGRF
jgi:hypothetical protein